MTEEQPLATRKFAMSKLTNRQRGNGGKFGDGEKCTSS